MLILNRGLCGSSSGPHFNVTTCKRYRYSQPGGNHIYVFGQMIPNAWFPNDPDNFSNNDICD